MKKLLKFILVFVLIIAVSTLAVSALSKIGSRSEEVRLIQTALKERGYYSGNVDGLFGTVTKNAVIIRVKFSLKKPLSIKYTTPKPPFNKKRAMARMLFPRYVVQ